MSEPSVHHSHVSHIRGRFAVLGIGTMQFPVGRYIVSIGIGPIHGGDDESERVEIAIFQQVLHDRKFVTRRVFQRIGLSDPKDDVAIITPERLRFILHELSKPGE